MPALQSFLFGILSLMENGEIRLNIEEENPKKESGYAAMVRLSDADRKYAEKFSEEIDVSNTRMILQYGYQAQKHVVDFSDRSLSDLPQHDYDEIKNDLNKMKKKIASFEREMLNLAEGGTLNDQVFASFKSAYERISSAVSETARRLEIHRSSLLRHHARLEDHYNTCMNYIREYDMYIYAGELCLKRSRSVNLNDLLMRAKSSGLREDVLHAQDYEQGCARLEKKLSDLSLSRQLPFQMCTEIRMMQNTDIVFAENLRSLCVNAFPLWKSRIILSYGTGTERYFDPQILKDSNAKLIAACDALIKALSLNRTKRKKGSFFTDQ